MREFPRVNSGSKKIDSHDPAISLQIPSCLVPDAFIHRMYREEYKETNELIKSLNFLGDDILKMFGFFSKYFLLQDPLIVERLIREVLEPPVGVMGQSVSDLVSDWLPRMVMENFSMQVKLVAEGSDMYTVLGCMEWSTIVESKYACMSIEIYWKCFRYLSLIEYGHYCIGICWKILRSNREWRDRRSMCLKLWQIRVHISQFRDAVFLTVYRRVEKILEGLKMGLNKHDFSELHRVFIRGLLEELRRVSDRIKLDFQSAMRLRFAFEHYWRFGNGEEIEKILNNFKLV